MLSAIGKPTDRDNAPAPRCKGELDWSGQLKNGRKKCVSQGEELASEPPLRGRANQARKKSTNRYSATKKKKQYGEPSTRTWKKNQDHHTSITHRIGMAHSPHPPLTLRGHTKRVEPSRPVPPPLLVAPHPSFQYPRCSVTGEVPPRLDIPPTPQTPVAAPACTPTLTPHCPSSGRAPTTATGPNRSIAPPHAQPQCDPEVRAYSGSFISPASSRNLDMLAPGMRRCGKAFQSDVPAASLITAPGVARDF